MDIAHFYDTKEYEDAVAKKKSKKFRKKEDKYIVTEIQKQITEDEKEGRLRLSEKRDKNLVKELRNGIRHDTAILTRKMGA